MVIWPLVKMPVHEFDPLYVPVIVILVLPTCIVPVDFAVHPVYIMLFNGMSIVNAMVSPVIVPEKVPAIPPCMPCIPAKFMPPVTVEPFCVSGQVIAPRPAWPIMLPVPIAVLESDAVPAHVPDMDVVDVVDIVGELAPQAAAKHVNRATANIRFIMMSIVPPIVRSCYSQSHSGVLRAGAS
jgi:hypothetical protein